MASLTWPKKKVLRPKKQPLTRGRNCLPFATVTMDEDDHIDSLSSSLNKHCGLEKELRLEACRLEDCKLEVCRLEDCRLEDCRLEDCRLEACRLEDCRLEDCRLEDCRLEDCRLEDCRLEDCRLKNCRLEKHFAPLWGGGLGRTVGISTISTCVCARRSYTGVC